MSKDLSRALTTSIKTGREEAEFYRKMAVETKRHEKEEHIDEERLELFNEGMFEKKKHEVDESSQIDK